MYKMLETIKKAATEAVEATKPMEVCFGSVAEIAGEAPNLPVAVKLGQKIILTDGQIVRGAGCPLCCIGDVVILIKLQGGQQYLLFDKKG